MNEDLGSIPIERYTGLNKVGVVSLRMPKNGIQTDQHTRWLSRVVLFRPYRNQRSSGETALSKIVKRLC